MTDFDIVVVGAGMVGAAAACRFSQDGFRVAVIEPRPPNLDCEDGRIDLRVSAISHASQVLLDSLGAWDRIDPSKRSPYSAMRVWDAQVPPHSADALCFDAAEIGEPDIGHIIENRRIVAALHTQLSHSGNVEMYSPASLQRFENSRERVTATLDDGREFTARLLVVADGANSATRAMADIDTQGWPYQQKGVVTHVSTDKVHDATAYQRFLPTGPIALLPLYDGRCSIVWSTTTDEATRLLELDDATFCTEVAVASDHVLGGITGCDRRAAFPLQLLHATQYVKPRLALVGDAAHTIHPLAGQGVNLGFNDVVHLAAAVNSEDPGDLTGLRRYERQAKSENLLMMGALDGLHRLFTADQPLVKRLRAAGLGLVNRTTPLKTLLMRRAVGS